MSKRQLISEQERERILNLHKNFDFKPLIKESRYDGQLDAYGEFSTTTEFKFIILSIVNKKYSFLNGKSFTIKVGKKIYVTKDQKMRFYIGKYQGVNLYADLPCPKISSILNEYEWNVVAALENSLINIGKGKVGSGAPNFHVGLRSMFCCNDKMKSYLERIYAVAYPKPGEKGYCNVKKPTKGCSEQCNAKPCPKGKYCPQVVKWFVSGDGCKQLTGTGGFDDKSKCEKCCFGRVVPNPEPEPNPKPKPEPTPNRCIDGSKQCTKFDSCEGKTVYKKCEKCEKIKELQRCLSKIPGFKYILIDGKFGCETDHALNKNGYTQRPVTDEMIKEICDSVVVRG